MARASSSIRLELDGVEELLKTLSILQDKVAKRVLAKAMGVALRPFRKAARLRAPTQTGLLKISIGNVVRKYKRADSTTVVGVSGPRRNVGGKAAAKIRGAAGNAKREPANYAHLIEFGTVSHTIRPRRGKKAVTVDGKPYSVVDVHGVRARPFMRPAWAAAKQDVQRTLEDEVGNGIVEEAKKAAANNQSITKAGGAAV
jgi:HK97 gp10 family phage protein